MVEQQSGYTLLPELATINLPDNQNKKIRYFKNPAPRREVSIVAHRSYIKQKLIGLLKNEILENLPPHLKNQKGEQVIEWVN